MIYLDNAATTYPKPECVYKELDRANRSMAFNAGRGSYTEAKAVSAMIDETRQMLADLVHLQGNCVSFESSATEALNLIINGLDLKEGDTVYVSPFEHNAIIRPLFNLKKEIGINIEILPFDKVSWEPDLKQIQNLFVLHKPKAVFLSHISNVTGYIMPYYQIFDLSKQYNAIDILDCSQSFGVLNPDIRNVDFVVFDGHKSLYASFGVGGFLNTDNFLLKIVKSGGTGSDSLNHDMPETGSGRYEAGSINSVAIAGLHESLKWLQKNDVKSHEFYLTKYLISKLSTLSKVQAFLPDDTSKVLGVVSVAVEGYSSADVGAILNDEYDICVRTGYHCSPFVHEFISSLHYGGTVRIGIGAFTTKEEIDQLIDALASL